jgi:hypothetical protein
MGRDVRALALVAAALFAITGCASTPGPSPTDRAAQGSAEPTAKATPSPTPTVFTVPASCLKVVSKDRQTTFAAMGLTLTYGPGSASGSLLERSPEVAQLGSIMCDWTTPDESSSIEIDIGPLPSIGREEIVTYLKNQYLQVATDGTAQRYFNNGKEFDIPKYQGSSITDLPAQMNVLRDTSWVTVSIYPGGPDSLTLATSIAAEAEAIAHAS